MTVSSSRDASIMCSNPRLAVVLDQRARRLVEDLQPVRDGLLVVIGAALLLGAVQDAPDRARSRATSR